MGTAASMGRPPFKLILFDFDGTLVDSQANIHRCMAQAFAADGLPPPALAEVRRVVGLSLELAVGKLLGEALQSRTARVTSAYREAFFAWRQHPDYCEVLFPGARDALLQLDQPDVCLGIATGKNLRGLSAALEKHALADRFITLQTPDHSPSKPHPGMVLRALAETGFQPQDAVLIGDTTYDIEMACNARISSLGVGWGYHAPDELRAAGARGIVEDFTRLPDVLAGLKETST
ncbi:HAD-IA family hydrolase [Aquibaculum sediminis]|uniref:HAD-IA family hydrolase n=1 Tax=Aquibaculum sediminis TaxID=3231907 RepID=UPI0034527F27